MKGAAIAHINVFPADVTLHPGDECRVQGVRLRRQGPALGEVKVDWSLAGSRLPEGLPPPPEGTPPPPALQGKLSDTPDRRRRS